MLYVISCARSNSLGSWGSVCMCKLRGRWAFTCASTAINWTQLIAIVMLFHLFRLAVWRRRGLWNGTTWSGRETDSCDLHEERSKRIHACDFAKNQWFSSHRALESVFGWSQLKKHSSILNVKTTHEQLTHANTMVYDMFCGWGVCFPLKCWFFSSDSLACKQSAQKIKAMFSLLPVCTCVYLYVLLAVWR